MNSLLSLLILLPLAASVLMFAMKNDRLKFVPFLSIAVAGIQFLITLFIFVSYSQNSVIGVNTGDFAFFEQGKWLYFKLGNSGYFSSNYTLGVDGLNLPVIFLSGFVLLIASLASFKIKDKGYHLLFLLLSGAVFGCFASLDLLIFYIFFEFMLLPMYFLIGIWGGERRQYAAIKFFIYTLLGSIFILAVMLGLYSSVIDPVMTAKNLGLTGDLSQQIGQVQELLALGKIKSEFLVHTFQMNYLADIKNFIPNTIFHTDYQLIKWGLKPREIAFLFLFIGFAVKLPLVPLHTWLPDAHVEAPTPISIILAGVLLKIGGYGLLRLGFVIFPDGAAHFSIFIGAVSMITILYGAYVALGQKNLKKMIAYSSVSHMGFVTLGLVSFNSLGISGAAYQMFSHGLIASMLFFCAGIIYDRTKNLEIDNYSGLALKMPYFTAFVVVCFFASLGLPGFCGFVGEVMVFLGTFDAAINQCVIPSWMVGLSLTGLVITAGYYLWTLQRMFFGQYWVKESSWDIKLTDLSKLEMGVLIALGLSVLLFGIYPSLLTDVMNPSIERVSEIIDFKHVCQLPK